MPLDIGVGVLFSLGVAKLFGVHATLLMVILGILFALAPDLDILPMFWPNEYNHRSWVHYPVVWVLPAVLIFTLHGALWGTLFSLCILSHFIHDTIGIGWGISWFAPFTKRKFLFPRKLLRKDYGWFMSWNPEEERAIMNRYDESDWIRAYYFRPNLLAYIEYGTLLLALITLWLYYK